MIKIGAVSGSEKTLLTH